MKKLFISAVLALSAFAATAATLNLNFVADNGRVFQIANVFSVDYDGSSVIVRMPNGSNQYFADASGGVYAKIKASDGFSSRFVRVGTSNRYMNTQLASEISCVSNQTAFGYYSANNPEFFNDGCALHNAVKAASN
jgi:hypothetical protein